MHAVRGTIGYDPNPVDKAAKQASRESWFAQVNADSGVAERIDLADTVLVAQDEGGSVPGFLVEWVNPAGQERFCGKASGGISAESVVRLVTTLSRTGRASVFTVTRTR